MCEDPELTQWESDFVKSAASQGRIYDYSEQQKAVIERMFLNQAQKYHLL